MDLSEAWAQLCAANERWTASDLRPMWEGPSPRIVDTVVVDYAAVGSVAARRAS